MISTVVLAVKIAWVWNEYFSYALGCWNLNWHTKDSQNNAIHRGVGDEKWNVLICYWQMHKTNILNVSPL